MISSGANLWTTPRDAPSVAVPRRFWISVLHNHLGLSVLLFPAAKSKNKPNHHSLDPNMCQSIDVQLCVEPCMIFTNRRSCRECVCPTLQNNNLTIVPPPAVQPPHKKGNLILKARSIEIYILLWLITGSVHQPFKPNLNGIVDEPQSNVVVPSPFDQIPNEFAIKPPAPPSPPSPPAPQLRSAFFSLSFCYNLKNTKFSFSKGAGRIRYRRPKFIAASTTANPRSAAVVRERWNLHTTFGMADIHFIMIQWLIINK